MLSICEKKWHCEVMESVQQVFDGKHALNMTASEKGGGAEGIRSASLLFVRNNKHPNVLNAHASDRTETKEKEKDREGGKTPKKIPRPQSGYRNKSVFFNFILVYIFSSLWYNRSRDFFAGQLRHFLFSRFSPWGVRSFNFLLRGLGRTEPCFWLSRPWAGKPDHFPN